MQRDPDPDTKHFVIFYNRNVISYNVRIIQEYFQPKIGGKIRIQKRRVYEKTYLESRTEVSLYSWHKC